jgi:hypothetical protein
MTTAIIFAVASMWVLFSALIVVVLCMNSSRLSQAEELPRDRRHRRFGHRREVPAEAASAALPKGSGVAHPGGQ